MSLIMYQSFILIVSSFWIWFMNDEKNQTNDSDLGSEVQTPEYYAQSFKTT